MKTISTIEHISVIVVVVSFLNILLGHCMLTHITQNLTIIFLAVCCGEIGKAQK